MSYEGYCQVLCENGHYHTFDAYDSVIEDSVNWQMYNGYGGKDQERKPWACHWCGKDIAWVNNVDETNGEAAGYVELEVEKESVFCTCPCCKNKHVVEQPTYKTPHGRGHRMSHSVPKV